MNKINAQKLTIAENVKLISKGILLELQRFCKIKIKTKMCCGVKIEHIFPL